MPAFASVVRQSVAAARCAAAESGASMAICFSGRPAHSASAAPSLPAPAMAASSAAMTAAVV
eukprot:2873398-Pleurochrysis_carterae.AAC.1